MLMGSLLLALVALVAGVAVQVEENLAPTGLRLPKVPRALAPLVAAPRVLPVRLGFEELGLRPELATGLREGLGIRGPNDLQQAAMPAALGRQNLVLGAQTGSGKTLAFMLPVLQSLKADEDAGAPRARPKRPRALVLVPTRELGLQVFGVAKALAHYAKVAVEVVHGGVPDAPQKRKLDRPVDVLVATPGRLVKLLEAGSVYLGDVRFVVVDEVDTMFEAGFGPDLDKVFRVTTRDLQDEDVVQHLAVGATHPASAQALYDKWLPNARRLLVDGSHTVPARLDERFVVANGPDAKVAALREVLGPVDQDGQPAATGRAVIFCNSQSSARFVDHTLSEEGYKTANYHGAVPAEQRDAAFQAFLAREAHVLVTTDLAARGLDNLAVEHVVQFDFAKSAADYLHRCGRTARAGRRGACTSLVTKADQDLVNAIKDAKRRGADVLAAGEEQQRKQRDRAKLAVKAPREAASPSPRGATASPQARGAGRGPRGAEARGARRGAEARGAERGPRGAEARGARRGGRRSEEARGAERGLRGRGQASSGRRGRARTAAR